MIELLSVLTLIVGFVVGQRVRSIQGARVVVTTVRGQSIRGRRALALGRVVLRDAELLGESAVSLEGRVEIPRRMVAMVQVLPVEAAVEALPKSSRLRLTRDGEAA